MAMTRGGHAKGLCAPEESRGGVQESDIVSLCRFPGFAPFGENELTRNSGLFR